MKSTKLIGGALLVGAGIGVWMALNKKGPFGLVSADQIAGRIAQRREREKMRAQAFLSRVTGQQVHDPYEHEVVMQASGLSAGQATEFKKVLHRQAREGVANFANYGDLGVAQ